MDRKNILLGLLIMGSVWILTAGDAKAQDNQMYGPEWGADATPMQRRDNVLTFNLYKEAYSQGDYPKAAVYLKVLLEKSPAGAQNIYVYGINMLKKEFAAESDTQRRGILADSIAMLYDWRLEHFSSDTKYGEAYITRQRAKDYALVFTDDRVVVQRAYEEAEAANAVNPDAEFYTAWFKELTDVDYKLYNMEPAEYARHYEAISNTLRQIDTSGEYARKVDMMFVESGVSSPENIERIVREGIAKANEIESEEDRYAELFALLAMMKSLGYEGELFERTAKRLMDIEPTTNVAATLAVYYQNSGFSDKAAPMWISAAENASTPTAKAQYWAMAASVQLADKQYDKAITSARNSLAADTSQAYAAHLIIAQSYAGSATEGELWDRKTVYWLAADELDKAIAQAGDDNRRRQATDLREQYAKNFPSGEEIFVKGLKQGDGYRVEYGKISETTIIRASDAK